MIFKKRRENNCPFNIEEPTADLDLTTVCVIQNHVLYEGYIGDKPGCAIAHPDGSWDIYVRNTKKKFETDCYSSYDDMIGRRSMSKTGKKLNLGEYNEVPRW